MKITLQASTYISVAHLVGRGEGGHAPDPVKISHKKVLHQRRIREYRATMAEENLHHSGPV